jgi:tRNA dimethylallyltransferase
VRRPASVAWWLEQAVACSRDIQARGKRVLFIGGTPLYLQALLHGLFDGPPADPSLRERLERDAQTLGNQALHDRLARVDPATAARLHRNDVRRIVRALEVWELTGRPISDWQQQWPAQCGTRNAELGMRNADSMPEFYIPHSEFRNSPILWLDRPRAELYARINERVDRMLAGGLIEEVRALRQLPRPLGRQAAQALGYKEMLAYLDGKATLEETRTRIQTRTRNFAKRQITWFRHIPECRPASEELTFQLWADYYG